MAGLEQHPYEDFVEPGSFAAPQAESAVDHPAHYGGANNPYEAIKVIEAWELGFNLGNAVKYIARAGRKVAAGSAETARLQAQIEDLSKAAWYLQREIGRLTAPESDDPVVVRG